MSSRTSRSALGGLAFTEHVIDIADCADRVGFAYEGVAQPADVDVNCALVDKGVAPQTPVFFECRQPSVSV